MDPDSQPGSIAEYCSKALEFALFPRTHAWEPTDDTGVGDEVPVYQALGLVGEAGELVEAATIANDGDRWARALVCKEIGDCLWYLAAIAEGMGTRLDLVLNEARTDEARWLDDPPFTYWDDLTMSASSFADTDQVTMATRVLLSSAILAQFVKKNWRDCTNEYDTQIYREVEYCLELLIWIAEECGQTLGQIAEDNINKLTDRHKRNVIRGSGDNR